MPRPLTILCAAKLHANQLERHLELLERCPLVGQVVVVRHAPVPERLSKVRNVSFGHASVPVSAARMYREIQRVAERERVDWMIAFNPVPWGTVAYHAARSQGLRTCLCIVGRDYQQLHTAWGGPFRRAVRSADAVTVTGQLMVDGLVRLGVEEGRMRVLPHSVDLDRFVPAEGTKRFDVLSVGQLIARKRMDVLIQATKLLKDRGLALSVGILGRGPEEASLRRLVSRLGLDAQVHFLGYRNDVEAVLQEAKVFCLVSDWEGVPFALMEAMAAGVVPIVTPVGTIGDWVESERNGLVVPNRDVVALAEQLERVLTPSSGKLAALRSQLISERQRLSFDAGVAVWTDILQDGGPAGAGSPMA